MYQQIRQMKGRGTKVAALDLAIGSVIRVDGVKYLVMAQPTAEPTGSVCVPSYSEDNQMENLFLSPRTPVAMLGSL